MFVHVIMKWYNTFSVVAPPLKNVRKRRFRKTARKNKLLESPEVEKEVKRLIREDLAAINVGIFFTTYIYNMYMSIYYKT